jgi:MinD-like ATPase involved in chromosome partitioning or flagellar assembly
VTPADQRDIPATPEFGVQSIPKKSAAKMVPQRGWRRTVYALTRINLGLSRDEKYEHRLHARIRRKLSGSYEIGVVGLKGGSGKTTVTAALGSVFAAVRGDRILAVDADQTAGNLADRVGRESTATIAHLLASDALSHYNDIRAHTSMNAVNLEVLSAAEYSAGRPKISAEEWRHALAVVPRYYNLVLADCASDLSDPATRGVLSMASGLVIVSTASIDGVRRAAVAIDWLRHSQYQALLNRACVVINHVAPAESNSAANDFARRFQQNFPGRVVVLPWDKHVATGTEIQLDLLGDACQRKVTELAAALSDDFDGGERR